MSSTTDSVTNELYTGRVKWFNNKAGYGFITVISAPDNCVIEKNTDVFVHHSVIEVNEEQYRYLVQGEYVQFTVSVMNEGVHKYQAKSVSGIGGGSLMCETRNNNRLNSRHKRKTEEELDVPTFPTKNYHQSKGFRNEDEDWVKKTKKPKKMKMEKV